MPFVTVGRENTADIRIHYNDHGTGAPGSVVEIADGPHHIGWTFPAEVNTALVYFISGR